MYNSLRQFCVFCALFCCFGLAQATIQGDKDPTFNSGQNLKFLNSSSMSNRVLAGFTRSTLTGSYLAATVYTYESDGHVETQLLRILPNGQPDTTLNGSGAKILLSNSAYVITAMATDSSNDNTILVGGNQQFSSTDVTVCRYTASGAVDNNLIGHSGVGCIFIADTSVGGANTNVLDVYSVLVQPSDHKIVIGGSVLITGSPSVRSMFVMRLLASGAMDTSFGSSGVKLYAFGLNGGKTNLLAALALDTSNRILVAGTIQNGTGLNYDFGLLRLTPSGVVDSTCGRTSIPCSTTFDFHQGGNFKDTPTAIGIGAGGDIYVAGTTETGVNGGQSLYASGLIRLGDNFAAYNFPGTTGFSGFVEGNTGGSESDSAPGLAIDANDRAMLAASYTHVFAWRILPTGVSDSNYGNGSSAPTGRVSVTAPPANGNVGEYAITRPIVVFDGKKPVIAAIAGVPGTGQQLVVARLLGDDTIFFDGFGP